MWSPPRRPKTCPGRKQDCRIELFDCAHEETTEMCKLVLAWFDDHLVAGA